jgi:hypothetical protein
MRKPTKLFYPLLTIVMVGLISGNAFAQLTGTKTIPGNYVSISAAITDLNTQGVGSGGVTFNVAAGHTETAANLVITAAGTSSNPIVFQKSGSGANPLITAGTGVSTTLDGIIVLSGTDYITFDGIDLQEDAANITTTTQMEWGYALLKVDGTNGCWFVTIKNCTITLNKANTNTRGIYSANHTSVSTSTITVTDTLGSNSNNKFYSNIISNANTGIWIGGYAASTPYILYDQNNEVGAVGGRQNKISNYATTTTAYGVYGLYQNGIKIFNTNINNSGGAASTSTLYGIFLSTGNNSNVDIYGDTVTIVGGATTSSIYAINNAMGSSGTSNTVNITDNVIQNCSYSTATSGSMYYIYQSASCYNMNVNNNKIINNNYGSGSTTSTGSTYFIYTFGGTASTNVWQINNNLISGFTRTQSVLGSGTHYFIYNSASGPTLNINNNTITDCIIPSTSTAYGIYCSSSYMMTFNCNNNTIKNISRPNSSTGGFYCYYQTSGASGGTATISNNSFRDVSISGSGTIYGIYSSASMDKNIYGDTLYNLTSTGGSIYGLYSSTGNTTKIYNNKVTALYTTSGTIYGGYITGGTTNYLYNNFISDLRATTSTSSVGIAGVYFSGGTNNYGYYNSIYMNASSSSATTFGCAGIYASTTPTLELKNNIVVNNSTPGPTGGFVSAYFRNAFNLTTYSTASDNNDFYAGTPAPNKLVYYDGTNLLQTMTEFKQLVTPRDASSFSENPPFINVSTPPFDLHINTSMPTGVESGGSPVTTPLPITTDYDNQTRNASTPDVGADEGNFTLGDLQKPLVVYTPLGNTGITTNRNLVATITDNLSLQNTPPNDPRIYFKKGINSTFKYRNKTSQAGDNFTFTIVTDSMGTLVVGDTVFYYAAAQDVGTPPLSPNCGTNPAGGSGVNPPGTTPPPVVNYYIITNPPMTGVYTIPGTPYATIESAINDLTLRGVGTGGVTFNVLAGHTESAANLVLEPMFTSASNPIVFQKSGSGANPLITAVEGIGSLDGIIKISGADYVTFDGIDVRDSSGNITTTTQMESGYALVKIDGTDGCRNITIKNCNITLNKTNTNTAGIYSANHTLTSTAAIAVTDTLGTNSNNKFYSNTISNVNNGIYIGGYNAPAPYDFYDQNNEVGTTGSLQNKIYNFGSTTTAYGIYCVYQNGIKIFNTNINSTGGTLPASALYGVYLSTGNNSNVNIYGDTVTLVNGGTSSATYAIYNAMGSSGTNNTVNIYNNLITGCSYDGATSASFYYIYQSASCFNMNLYNNNITGNTYGSASATATGTIGYIYTFGGNTNPGSTWKVYNNNITNNSRVQTALSTGTVYTIYTSATGQTYEVYDNIISDNIWPSSSSTRYGIYASTSNPVTVNVYGNTLKNISAPNASAGTFYAIYFSTSNAANVTSIYNNSVNNISSTGSTTMYGIYASSSSTGLRHVYGDTVYALTSAGGTMYGIYLTTSDTSKVYNNRIYDLNTTTGSVYGVYVAGGNNTIVYNSMISELKATASTSSLGVSGIYFSSGTNNYSFFNTIYLNAVSSSVTTFGTAGIYASTTPTTLLKNNIVVNVSTPGPTGGNTVAYQRSSATLTSYSNISDYNDFYAGAPGANNLIFYDGTNSDQTMEAYKIRVAPRDANSFTENPPFLNVSTPPYNLHISPSIGTRIESGGSPVTAPAAIVDDYDNQVRNVTTPDVGADEGSFTSLLPSAPVLVAPPNGATNQTLTPLLDWNDVSGATSYRIQVATNTSFTSPAFDTSGITASQITVPAGKLNGSTLYYWRVNAANASGSGPWSSVWNFTTQSLVPSLTIKVYLEGFYSPEPMEVNSKGTNLTRGLEKDEPLAQVEDTIRIYLADSLQNYAFVDSVKVFLPSTGTYTTPFTGITTGKYFIVVKHRNHLETWSKYAVNFTGGGTTSYDFTTAASQAYGDNMKQVGSAWVIYGGDPNQDGDIGALDIPIFISQFGTQGYLSCDFNGDNDVTGVDMLILIQNFGITTAKPGGTLVIVNPEKRVQLKEFQNKQDEIKISR